MAIIPNRERGPGANIRGLEPLNDVVLEVPQGGRARIMIQAYSARDQVMINFHHRVRQVLVVKGAVFLGLKCLVRPLVGEVLKTVFQDILIWVIGVFAVHSIVKYFSAEGVVTDAGMSLSRAELKLNVGIFLLISVLGKY